MKVLAIGDINVDLIVPSKLPARGKQAVVEDFQIYGGGCAANFALACAKLGAKSKLVGRVGDDLFGKFVLGELKRQGVDIRDVVISKGRKTGVTIALVKGAERSFITYRGENAVFSKRDIGISKIDADLVHIPSFFLLENLRPSYTELARRARAGGAMTSFDTGWDPFGKWSRTQFLMNALRNFDVFLPNIDEARAILSAPRASDAQLARRFLGLGLKVVAIKKGRRGCFVADESGSAQVPAFRIKVVDSTGAGDVFNAAFLLAYLDGNDLLRAGRFANAAAAISVTGAGWSKYPMLKQVRDFLNQRAS
ncbi:MAG: carbohydrate kinase family protein [Candidatus Hodarchaeaceae archaeon]|nr:carbohydrate kinase family protein [Candidatus Hodarchaeaceae archaeon]